MAVGDPEQASFMEFLGSWMGHKLAWMAGLGCSRTADWLARPRHQSEVVA